LIIRAVRSRLVGLHALRGRRGVKRSRKLSASCLWAWLSIQPKHRACSTGSAYRTLGCELRAWRTTRPTFRSVAPCSASQARQSPTALTVRFFAEHLQVVLIEHDAERVAERVGDRGGDRARPTHGRRRVRGGAEGVEALERAVHVVDGPVGHGSAGVVGTTARREAPVDDAELVLIVAQPELDVGQPAVDGPLEVRLDPEQLAIPAAGGIEIIGEVGDVVSPRNMGQHPPQKVRIQ
jgi:hypothetical protein